MVAFSKIHLRIYTLEQCHTLSPPLLQVYSCKQMFRTIKRKIKNLLKWKLERASQAFCRKIFTRRYFEEITWEEAARYRSRDNFFCFFSPRAAIIFGTRVRQSGRALSRNRNKRANLCNKKLWNERISTNLNTLKVAVRLLAFEKKAVLMYRIVLF